MSCDCDRNQHYLSEKRILPNALNPEEVCSNGFFSEATLEDFPQ